MAGNDRIIYKGVIYGNTVTTEKALVATAPGEVQNDGTEIYTVSLPGKTETVEIAKGGRITYGTSNLQTVVCQGIKMTRGNDVVQNFSKGLLLPTDLYTAFTLKHGLKKEPNITASTSGPWIAENYNLMAVYYTKNSTTDEEKIAYCFVPTDCHVYEDDNHNEKNAYYPINTDRTDQVTINRPGNTIFNNTYSYHYSYFPTTYTSAVKATEAITTGDENRGMFSYDYGTINYLGIYFLVPGVFSIDDNNEDEGIYIYKNGMYTKDYVKEDKNFCIPHGYNLPTISSGNYNLNNYDIVSIKDNITGKRTFYLYYENEILGNKISEVDLSQFNSINFTYIGDVVSIPATGNIVTRKSFSNTDTIENILKQAFGDTITIYYRDTTYNLTDFFVNNYNNSIYMQAEEYSRVKGYASVIPYIIAIREYGKNLLPKFYIKPDVVLQKYANDTFNLPDKNLVSIKDTNGNRTFYVYHSKDDMIKKFEMSDLCGSGILYKGDVRQIPDNGNSVTHVDFEESDTVENILEQLFGENITINRSNNAGQNGDINVTSSLNNHLTIATSGKAMYTESINNEFIFYNLLYSASGQGADTNFKICAPFLNEAEFKFAFGEREDLQYITEEEYQEIIDNNTEDISDD